MFIEVSNLSFNYYESKGIIKGLSFDAVGPGLYIISGKNGSGKTSLLKLLSGILKPDTGTIKINNIKVQDIAYNFLTSSLFLSPTEFDTQLSLKRVLKYFKLPTSHEILDKFNLDTNNLYGTLSEGEKNKFRLYISYFSKGIVLIDEPLKSLDKDAEHLVNEILIDMSKYKLLIITSPKKHSIFTKAKDVITLDGKL